MAVSKNTEPNIIFLNFADNKIPEFREVNSKDWILFGEKNNFPEHLLYLFNKSSNHNAIINGKVTYILGSGLPLENEKLKKVNKNGESINKILRKSCIDIELFGGFYLQLVADKLGRYDIFHTPFENVRKGKDGGYWVSKKWSEYTKKEYTPVFVPEFEQGKPGAQIFCYKEYRPGCDAYPLPGYFGALNDIETDVEISKYNLSVIKQGMFSSKMITFKNGDPGEEGKRKLEKRFKEKFQGSTNGGNVLLVFNKANEDAPTVEDLSTTDLDKLFDQLNKTTQAEIFSGHQVTSPMLFGIMEPGKLGGRNELQDAYEIFKNTYINEKQLALEEVLKFILPILGVTEELKFVPVEPIGFRPTDAMIESVAPKEWILEKVGIDPSKYPSTQMPGLPGVPAAPVNENMKNLTGRQTQSLERLINKYKKGKLTREAVTTMLQKGFGLGDEDIEKMLFNKKVSELEVIEMFEACGELSENFSIVESSEEIHADKFVDIRQTDSNILDLIRKDKRITPEIIASTLKIEKGYVTERIKSLEEKGVLRPTQKVIGIDTIIERAINPEVIDTREPAETVDVFIKYAYRAKPGEKPIIPTTRAFCKRLIELNRLYTRAEIESISQRVGFSVWDRKGGFWGDSPECRHRWVREIVIKKR
jgi:DNA-binding Lrp family transcriptional regulator